MCVGVLRVCACVWVRVRARVRQFVHHDGPGSERERERERKREQEGGDWIVAKKSRNLETRAFVVGTVPLHRVRLTGLR